MIDLTVVIGAKFATCLKNLERKDYMECLSNKNKEKRHASQSYEGSKTDEAAAILAGRWKGLRC